MLPQPSAEQQAHSNALTTLIHAHIENAGGWIGFDEYMQLALYEPTYGYYTSGSEKFGEAGDFVTAPLLGNLFAGCVARQCAEILADTGLNHVVEFGAGTGALAQGVLAELEQLGFGSVQYSIIETSADLTHRQQNRLRDNDRVEWLTELPDLVEGILLGNELLDAIPCKRIIMTESGFRELGVKIDQKADKHALVWQVSDEPLGFDFPGQPPAVGYTTEWSPRAGAWIQSVGKRLRCGAMMLIDYGFPAPEFYHADRDRGTLMCHYRHHAHDDPFLWPGLQDITSHIDFSSIAAAGKACGLELAGYCSQGDFLMSNGLLEQVHSLIVDSDKDNDMQRQLALSAEVKKLTMPHEMGELFKVIALTRNLDLSLSGFSRVNKKYRLLND